MLDKMLDRDWTDAYSNAQFSYPGAQAHRIQALEGYENMSSAIKMTEESASFNKCDLEFIRNILPIPWEDQKAVVREFTLSPESFHADWRYRELRILDFGYEINVIFDVDSLWPLRVEMKADNDCVKAFLSNEDIYQLLKEYGAVFGFSEYKDGFSNTHGSAAYVRSLSIAGTNYEISLMISENAGIMIYKISVV